MLTSKLVRDAVPAKYIEAQIRVVLAANRVFCFGELAENHVWSGLGNEDGGTIDISPVIALLVLEVVRQILVRILGWL